MDSIRIPRIWWFIILFAFSQGALCESLTSERTPCSLRGPEVFSPDACSYNCDSKDSVGQDLVQVFDYMHAQKNTSDMDYKQILPNETSAGQDQATLAGKMADKSLQYWWNNSDIMNSSIGQSVKSAEKKMNQEVNLGNGGGDPTAKKQKLDFAVDAFQSQAKVKYEGYGNAEVIYKASDSSVALQMVEKVGKSQDLIFGVRSSDQSSQVMYKLNW